MNVNTWADHCHGTRRAHTALCLQKWIPLCFQPHLLSSLLSSLGFTTQVQQLQFSVPTATHNKSGRFKQHGFCPSHFLLTGDIYCPELLPNVPLYGWALPRVSRTAVQKAGYGTAILEHWQPHAMQHFLQLPWSAYRKNKKFCIFLFSTLFLCSP